MGTTRCVIVFDSPVRNALLFSRSGFFLFPLGLLSLTLGLLAGDGQTEAVNNYIFVLLFFKI